MKGWRRKWDKRDLKKKENWRKNRIKFLKMGRWPTVGRGRKDESG